MTPEMIAQKILHAAGSGLRHYTPQSLERIKAAAKEIRTAILDDAAKRCDVVCEDYFIKGGVDDAPWNKGAVDGAKECAEARRGQK